MVSRLVWIWIFATTSTTAGFAQSIPNSASSTPPVTWKLATGYLADSFHGKNLALFAQDIEQATGGKLKIALHSNNSLVKLNDIKLAVQKGQIQAGETIMSAMVKDLPLAGADSVPFVVDSYANAFRMWQLQRRGVEHAFAASGLMVLYAVPWPPQGLYSQKSIVKEADFRGTKMRTYNASTTRIAELLGAEAVDIPTAAIASALANGQIDSMITSSVTGVENKVWSHLNYYYEMNAWFPKNIVFANAEAFRVLPKEVQQIVVNAANDAQVRGWLASQLANSEAMKTLKLNGIKVQRIPSELNTRLKRLGEKFSLEWVRTVGQDANAIFIPYYAQ